MCIAYPARVVSVDGGSASVEVLGRPQVVLLVLIDDGPPVTNGDWLLVQTGLALARIDEAEAAERTALIAATADPIETSGGPT